MALSGSTPISKVIALTLLVFGTGLVFWAYQLSGSLENQVSSAFTGAATDKVMYTYIAGSISLVIGLYLQFKK